MSVSSPPRNGLTRNGLPSSERVYRALRADILDGRLPPATRLIELQLASQFEVSRTPVREALFRLEAEGLASLDPVRGMVVRGIDRAEAQGIYEIREVLDGLAARLAAERITPEQLSKLRVLTELMQQAAQDQRWEAVVQMNLAFHELLHAAARNERLGGMAYSLEETVRRFSPVAFGEPERLHQVIQEHVEIIEALQRGDPEQAEATARRHMQRARQNLQRLADGRSLTSTR